MSSSDQAPVDPGEMEREDLEDEVEDLRDELQDLRADVRKAEALTRKFNHKMEVVERLLVGQDELAYYETDEIDADPFHSRLQEVEEEVLEHDEKLAMVQSGKATDDSPDGRAETLRQVCYEKAKKNDGLSKLTRDEAESALGGGLHRQTLLDAMKRAADGKKAELADDYNSINGSSDLAPQEGLEFVTGQDFDQSSLRFDAEDLTSAAARQNLTTGGDR